MNKVFLKYSLQALVSFLFVTGTTWAQSVKVEASLQDFTMKIGDQTKLFLIVSQPVGQHVSFPKLQDTITKNVEIVSANKADTVVDQQDKNRITITQGFTITSFEDGIHSIPAFSFSTAAGVIKSNDLSLQVQTVKIDTSKAIFDIKKPIVVTYTFWDRIKDNWILIVSTLIVVVVIAGIIYYVRKRPKKEPIIKLVKPIVPAHAIAIDKLNQLKAKKLWQQDEFKRYYSELTDIVREYLEQRFDVRTYEKTTDEIMASLNNRSINTEYIGIMQQLLTLADLAKFAKLNPLPHENEASMENALAFVLKTQQADKPISDTDGGSANGPI